MNQLSRAMQHITGGKLRIWWVGNNHKTPAALLFIILCMFYLLASHFENQDLQSDSELAHARAHAAQSERDLIAAMPKTVFIIEASTPQEAYLKLSKIAGDVDTQRAKLIK